MVTLEQLKKIYPLGKSRAAKFLDGINETFEEFEINNELRIAAFLAQIGHESGQLLYVKEIASGKAYEGRKDLGNTEPGDGVRFKGRGLIQITGRSNYVACGKALNLDLITYPELLEVPEHACRSAGFFWGLKHLNDYADSGDMRTITKRINGGLNGFEDRMALYTKALEVLE